MSKGLSIRIQKFRKKENEMITSKKEAMILVKHGYTSSIRYFCDKLRNDKQLCLLILKDQKDSYQYVSEKLKKDKDIILTVINESSNRFLYPQYIRDIMNLDNDDEDWSKKVKRVETYFEKQELKTISRPSKGVKVL